jgi:hypothetical protein
MTTIPTQHNGVLNFEDDYLLRLNEMPEMLGYGCFKAQAIIARTTLLTIQIMEDQVSVRRNLAK